VVLLDVRETEEVRTGSIEGAVTIPRGFLEFRAAEHLPQTDTDIVVYCASGARAGVPRLLQRGKRLDQSRELAPQDGGVARLDGSLLPNGSQGVCQRHNECAPLQAGHASARVMAQIVEAVVVQRIKQRESEAHLLEVHRVSGDPQRGKTVVVSVHRPFPSEECEYPSSPRSIGPQEGGAQGLRGNPRHAVAQDKRFHVATFPLWVENFLCLFFNDLDPSILRGNGRDAWRGIKRRVDLRPCVYNNV
jgi:hypothetical protein